MSAKDRHDNYVPLAVGGALLVLLLIFVMDLSAAVRVQIVVGYVLVLTLIAVWRYTLLTARMVEAVKEQVGVAQKQVGAVNQQLEFERLRYHLENKPIVYLDAERVLGSQKEEDIRYVARNVGPGLAVNVHQVYRGPEFTKRIVQVTKDEAKAVDKGDSRSTTS